MKYGDADWQVEKVQPATSPVPEPVEAENRDIPESQLPADARKLDDPKTLEAVNVVKQQRKEYVDRLNEAVNEWKQIQE